MNPYLIFGLGAVTGIGLSSYGRPLLVRLFRAGMVTTGYAKTAGSYAAGKVQSMAETVSSLDLGRLVPARHTEERRRKKSTARRKTKTSSRTPKKKTSGRTRKTQSRSRTAKKKTASRTAKKKTASRTPKATS